VAHRGTAHCNVPVEAAERDEWNVTLSQLEEAQLVTTTSWPPPLVKGYDEEKAREALHHQEMNRSFPLGDREIHQPPRRLGHGMAVEAHALVREYFARHLRDRQPEAWREGHRRLHEYLKESVPYWLEGLQPLYQDVAHGCHAG
jgi:hypothetical protein